MLQIRQFAVQEIPHERNHKQELQGRVKREKQRLNQLGEKITLAGYILHRARRRFASMFQSLTHEEVAQDEMGQAGKD